MAQRPEPKDFKASLLSGEAVARQATLERMRGKLAGRSVDLVAREEGRRRVVLKKRFAWGWRTALAVLFLAANAALVIKFKPDVSLRRATAPKAPALSPSPALSLNDQALYWTYALYDFNRLVARYGAPPKAVVSAQEARANLERLLPKVDGSTRFAIEQYLPRKGSRS